MKIGLKVRRYEVRQQLFHGEATLLKKPLADLSFVILSTSSWYSELTVLTSGDIPPGAWLLQRKVAVLRGLKKNTVLVSVMYRSNLIGQAGSTLLRPYLLNHHLLQSPFQRLHYTMTASSHPPPTASPLLSLPPELRIKIWSLCLPPSSQIETEWGLCFAQCVTSRNNEFSYLYGLNLPVDLSIHVSVPLLQVNHQLREEALPFAKGGGIARFSHHACLSDFLGAMNRRERKQVRNLRVTYSIGGMGLFDLYGVMQQEDQSVYGPVTGILKGWFREEVVCGEVKTVAEEGMRVLTFDVRVGSLEGERNAFLEKGEPGEGGKCLTAEGLRT
jgi:hypothetical protein